MTRPNSLIAGAALLATIFACSEPDPAPSPPKTIRAVGETSLSGTVGTNVAGGLTVHVIDYSDRNLAGAKVGFSVTGGDGSVTSRLVITDGEGIAHTDWKLGETAGANEVIASIYGIDSTATFAATGTAGTAVGLSITPRILRIPSTATSGTIAARVVDQFANVITGTPSYTSRNEAIVTVNNAGQVAVTNNNRGTSTWVVVTTSGFTDSAQVFNLSATDPPCTGITAMAVMNVGDVKVTGFNSDNGICVPPASGEREYALVPFFDTPIANAQTVFTIRGFGVKATAAPLGALRVRDPFVVSLDEPLAAVADANRVSLDRRLRVAERRELAARAPASRQWFSTRDVTVGRRAERARGATLAAVGDQVQLNVNAEEFCANPIMRTGRVAAVTTKAIVVADLANPSGFTDADYLSFGLQFDTLAYPSTVTNFGAATDLDNNGDRVIVFFTHAVNELGAGVLGFAYARDLLPRDGPLGSCPGSNLGEVINLRVPDPALSAAAAAGDAVATMAHEFQHVINSARRLYVNNATAAAIEEVWLNEGLSHIAEELVFYRAAGLTPRQNLGTTQLSPTANATAFTRYARRNFDRYFLFTRSQIPTGPVGVNDLDDQLETRGAIWSFLRFAADQRYAGNEAAFWRSLVDANSTGIQNLYDHVGADTRQLMRQWSISNFLDDLVTTEAKYTQPSWNLRQVPGFLSPINQQLTTQTSPVTASSSITQGALSASFIRFAVGSNQEAYVAGTGSPANTNAQFPRAVLLAIVRTK